jgi:hypothetical protein
MRLEVLEIQTLLSNLLSLCFKIHLYNERWYVFVIKMTQTEFLNSHEFSKCFLFYTFQSQMTAHCCDAES